MSMEIKFIRSECPSSDCGPGYNVWTNRYSNYYRSVGFISDRSLPGMVEYFKDEGFVVNIIDDPNHMSVQTELVFD